LAAWAGHEFAPDEAALHEELLQEAEGNPFFILEITRHLVEAGRLQQHDGRWMLDAKSPGDLDLPEGVRDVIGRRLSRLSETSNAVLANAAILGREFDFDVLAAMTAMDDESVLIAVEEGLRARLLVEVSGPCVPTYAFTHALIREALLDEFALARKQRLHLRAAQALEAVSAHRKGLGAATLAVHYRQAGTFAPPEKAIGISIEAGREAARALAWEEVAAHWQAALELMEERGSEPDQRADLLSRLAALLYVTGLDVVRAIEHTETALRLYKELGEEERAAGIQSRLAGYRVMFPEAMDVASALSHLRAAEDVLGRGAETPALGYVYAGLAAVGLWGLRTDEGLAAARRAMDIGERYRVAPLWIQGAELAGYFLPALGSLGEGLQLVERAWHLADGADHRITAMVSVWIRGGWSVRLFDPLDGAWWFERELAKPRLARSPIQRRIMQGNLAWTRILSGELDEGRQIAIQASGLLVGENLLPPLELWDGDWETAVARLHAARDQARERGDRYNEAGVGQWLAEALRLRGDHEQAKAVLEETLLLALEAPDVSREVPLRLLLAIARVEQDRLEEAQEHLHRACELMQGDEDWRGLAGRRALAEAVLAATGGEPSDDRFQQAVEVFRRYHVPWDEAEAFLLWGRALSRAGNASGARDRLDAAADIYRRIGAGQAWLERAKEAQTTS
jgi:tetratricopeptide (TPR) repeat protein